VTKCQSKFGSVLVQTVGLFKSSGSTRASKIYSTKSEAIKAGRQQAINNHAELVSQKRNGQINLKNSYGNDPMPPKDKD
jgi:hypothetical protein